MKHKNILEYILILTAIATSGFPSFISYKFVLILYIPLLMIMCRRGYFRIPQTSRHALIILSLFFILHGLLGHLTFVGVAENVLRYCSLFLIALAVNENIAQKYVRIIFVFALISIPFWLAISFSSSIHMALIALGNIIPQLLPDNWLEHSTNLGTSLYFVYIPFQTDYYMGLARNCGPFYEPGLFASFLEIALVFNILRTRKLFSFVNLILIAAVLSTFSSAGYVTLIVIFFLFAVTQKKRFYKILIYVVSLVVAIQVVQLDFMGDKIQGNMESDKIYSRFTSFSYHMEKLKLSPIVGYAGGTWPRTQMDAVFGTDSMDSFTTPNGISYALTFWGIPLGIVFFVWLYRSLACVVHINNRKEHILAFLAFLTLSFSQTVTVMPMFIMLVSMGALKQTYYE